MIQEKNDCYKAGSGGGCVTVCTACLRVSGVKPEAAAGRSRPVRHGAVLAGGGPAKDALGYSSVIPRLLYEPVILLQ